MRSFWWNLLYLCFFSYIHCFHCYFLIKFCLRRLLFNDHLLPTSKVLLLWNLSIATEIFINSFEGCCFLELLLSDLNDYYNFYSDVLSRNLSGWRGWEHYSSLPHQKGWIHVSVSVLTYLLSVSTLLCCFATFQVGRQQSSKTARL